MKHCETSKGSKFNGVGEVKPVQMCAHGGRGHVLSGAGGSFVNVFRRNYIAEATHDGTPMHS